MPWPPEDPDMWAVEAAFGKHNKRNEAMDDKLPAYDPTKSDAYGNDLNKISEAIANNLAAPVNHQVGGDHYAKMKIQPSRFAMANDYDADAFSILKYLSRHRAKDGKQGIEKALSFIDIRLDNREFIVPRRVCRIPIGLYIHENGFDHNTAIAIRDLNDWVINGTHEGPLCDHLRHSIKLILGTYG